jgi:hypothetical protein
MQKANTELKTIWSESKTWQPPYHIRHRLYIFLDYELKNKTVIANKHGSSRIRMTAMAMAGINRFYKNIIERNSILFKSIIS